jgi:hypothetical protein
MALAGKASTAHEYDKGDQCIHCRMYRNMVEALVHVCTREREVATDGHWMGKKVADG